VSARHKTGNLDFDGVKRRVGAVDVGDRVSGMTLLHSELAMGYPERQQKINQRQADR